MSRDATKTGVLVVLGCLFAVGSIVAVGVLVFIMGSMKGGAVEEIAERLPKDTTSLVAIRGLTDLAVEFREVAALVGADQSFNQDLEELRREGKRVLGFDPTSLQAWMNSGLDLTRPWAAATSADADDLDSGVWTLWVPVSDEVKVLAWVERVAKEARGVHRLSGEEHLIRIRDNDKLAYRMVDDFLVFTFSLGRSDATSLKYSRPVTGDSLADQQTFKDTLAAAGDDWHGLSYGSPRLLAHGLAELADEAGLPPMVLQGLELQSYVSTTHLDNEAARLAHVFTHADGKGLRAVFPENARDRLGRKIPGTPYFVARISLSPKGIWAALSQDPQTGVDLREAREDLRSELGIDLKDQVVDALGGHTSLAILQGGKRGFDLVAYTDIEDWDRFAKAADTVIGKLEFATGGLIDVERGSGGTWVSINDQVVGLTENHLVYSTRPLSVFREQVVGGSGDSYMDKLPGEARGAMESGPSVYAYLDVLAAIDGIKGAARALRGLLDLKADDLDVLDDVKRVLRGVELKLDQADGHLRSDLVVYAGPEGFSKGLVGLAHKYGGAASP